MDSSRALGDVVGQQYTHSQSTHSARLFITVPFAKDFDMFDFAHTHTRFKL